MKVLVSVDIEGIAGVFHGEQIRPGNPEYERARRWMTEEANAAVEGALAGGASEILVSDGHAHYRNLLADLLHPAARLAQGKPQALGMLAGLDDTVDGIIMVGYHGMAHSRGILAHTLNGYAFAGVWRDGVEIGEAGIYGSLAAEHGVPVILASGDDVLGAEARGCFPDASVVCVKTAGGCLSGISSSPQQARTLLRDSAREAVARLAEGSLASPAPHRKTAQWRLQAGSVQLADLFAQLPLLERPDAVTLEFAAPSTAYAVRVLNCLSAMSAALR